MPGSFLRHAPKHAARVFGLAVGLGVPFSGASASTLLDSANRKVEVPADVSRVVPAGAPAQVLLQALAPGKLAGLVEPFQPEHAIYVDPKLAALPQIPQLTRTVAPGDVAAVAALKPALVVDYGNVSARFVAADAQLQDTLKVPTVLYGGALADAAGVATTLGTALGEGARGAQVAKLARDVLARAEPLSDLPDAARVPVYVARGQDGLNALRGGTSFDEPIRLAGGRNVVTASGATVQRMSVDAVVALKPKVVIFAEEEALTAPLRMALPKDVTVVLDAGEPYKALSGPPSLNRLVGLAALASILHPDMVEADPEFVLRTQAGLFPPPPGVAFPSPLQVAR